MSVAPALGQYDHMVHNHYLDRVRRLHTERDGRISELSTAEDAQVRRTPRYLDAQRVQYLSLD